MLPQETLRPTARQENYLKRHSDLRPDRRRDNATSRDTPTYGQTGEEDNATSRDTPTYGQTGDEIMLPQETLRPTAGQEKR